MVVIPHLTQIKIGSLRRRNIIIKGVRRLFVLRMPYIIRIGVMMLFVLRMRKRLWRLFVLRMRKRLWWLFVLRIPKLIRIGVMMLFVLLMRKRGRGICLMNMISTLQIHQQSCSAKEVGCMCRMQWLPSMHASHRPQKEQNRTSSLCSFDRYL